MGRGKKDSPEDWKRYKKLEQENEKLKREVAKLRKLVNSNCIDQLEEREERVKESRKKGIEVEPIEPICDNCGKTTYPKAIVFDHCHKTLEHRGWLCDSCNRSIGVLGDDQEGLAQALGYVTKIPKNEILDFINNFKIKNNNEPPTTLR